MEIIERYLSEVGRQLPDKKRVDIETEIRSLIEAALEDRAQKTGSPLDEELAIEVLKEFGAPDKIARSYQPERYLIGPQLFPAFLTVVKIALPIIVIISALSFGISVSQSDLASASIFKVLVEGLAEMVGSAFQVLGSIIIIFAIVEWCVPGLKVKTLEKDWDPRSLPKPAAAPQKVGVVEFSFEMAMTAIALVIFNFYPQIIGIGFSIEQSWRPIPILAEVFFSRYLVWLNFLWVSEIILDAILIGRGRWETVTSWFYMTIKGLGMILALAMLTGPSLVGVTAERLMVEGGMSIDQGIILTTLFTQGMRVALVLTIVFGGVDLVKQLYRMVFKKMKPVVLVKEQE
jgi:hypothetical protein